MPDSLVAAGRIDLLSMKLCSLAILARILLRVSLPIIKTNFDSML